MTDAEHVRVFDPVGSVTVPAVALGAIVPRLSPLFWVNVTAVMILASAVAVWVAAFAPVDASAATAVPSSAIFLLNMFWSFVTKQIGMPHYILDCLWPRNHKLWLSVMVNIAI